MTTEDELPLLDEPRDGVPQVISTPEGLASAVFSLARGTGPVAVDAERAAGIRYGQRAFLVQLRREGAGTVLLDPEALPTLTEVNAALSGVEWILHSATQDLPCLAECGMRPDALFDTELAARLLGYERFGLASVVAELLGVRLAKEHSAADWSIRPLPESWLSYAALDVELLGELRAILGRQLDEAGKAEYARQEFEHLLAFEPRTYPEPWRRVHGLGAVKSPRALGRVRAMWALRDDLAEERDVAPGRVLPDRGLIAIATSRVRCPADISKLKPHPTPADARRFYEVMVAADALPESMMPLRRSVHTPRAEVDRQTSRDRLDAMRRSVGRIAQELSMPHDILLTPRFLKSLAAQRSVGDEQAVGEFLRACGARQWQIELTAGAVARSLSELG